MAGPRRFAALIAAFSLAAACGAPKQPTLLRMAYPHQLMTLDPHAHADTVTGTVLSAVYESLVVFEPGIPVRPLLADTWTTPDDLTWRVHVRGGVRFHDGSELTPADVIASLERARASAVAGHLLEDIVELRELPERVVEIVTDRPAPLLLTRLETVPIAPRDLDPAVPVGTGPYRWLVGSTQGPVVLHRWDGYWGADPHFDEISIEFVPYEEELATLIRRGKLDVVALVSHEYLHDHIPTAGWRVETSSALAVTYLGLNLTVPPLDDPEVRLAIELAVDREALVAAVFPPETAEPARTLVPPAIFGYSPEHRRAAADPERARQLLEAARAGGPRPLRLDCAGRYARAASELASMLAAVGLQVEVNVEPYESLYRRLEGGATELFIFGWTYRVADASLFLDTFVHSRDPERGLGTFNAAGISDPELDELIDTAAAEPNNHLRLEELRSVLSRVGELNAYQPLFAPKYLSLVRDGIVVDGPALVMQRPQDYRTQR